MGKYELVVSLQQGDQKSSLGRVGRHDVPKSFSTPIGTFRAGQDQTFEAFFVTGFHIETGMEQPEQIFAYVSESGAREVRVGENGTGVIFELKEHKSRIGAFVSSASALFSVRVE